MHGSWDGLVIKIRSSSGDTKLTFKAVSDLIIGKDIYTKDSCESSSLGSLLSMYGTCRKAKSGRKGKPNRRKCNVGPARYLAFRDLMHSSEGEEDGEICKCNKYK